MRRRPRQAESSLLDGDDGPVNVARAMVWLLAAAVTGTALWTAHGTGVMVGGLVAGAGLIVLGLRRKAPVEPGALHPS